MVRLYGMTPSVSTERIVCLTITDDVFFLYPNHQKKNLSTSLKLAQISKPNNRNIPTI